MTAPRFRSIAMPARGFLVLVIAAVGLAAPAAANADDLYVTAGAGATTCAQDDPCSLPQAITIADIVSNRDKIHVVGSLDYSGAVDLSNSPIDLIGSGSGANGTAIDAGAGALVVGTDSSASALRVHSTGHSAVTLESGAAVDHAEIVGDSNAVSIDAIAGKDYATIRDSHIEARRGISDGSSVDANGARIERTTIESTAYGVGVENSRTKIANSVIRTRAAGAAGVWSVNTAEISIDGTTIDGGGAGRVGVESGPIASGATIVLTGSIVRGVTTDLSANALRAGPGLTVSDSDFATKNGQSISDAGGHINPDPSWLDSANGDYRLAGASPVVDRGATRAAAPGETDRAGNPRVADGNGDGAAARDMGAFEYQYLPPATAPGQPASAPPADAQVRPADAQAPPSSPAATAFTVRVGALVLNRRGTGRVAIACSAMPCSVKVVVATTAKRPRVLARGSG